MTLVLARVWEISQVFLVREIVSILEVCISFILERINEFSPPTCLMTLL